jgi:hypothetical protein
MTRLELKSVVFVAQATDVFVVVVCAVIAVTKTPPVEKVGGMR